MPIPFELFYVATGPLWVGYGIRCWGQFARDPRWRWWLAGTALCTLGVDGVSGLSTQFMFTALPRWVEWAVWGGIATAWGSVGYRTWQGLAPPVPRARTKAQVSPRAGER